MKKLILILFLVFVVNPLFSQIGIKGGVNFSNLNTSDYKSLPGFQVGLFLHSK